MKKPAQHKINNIARWGTISLLVISLAGAIVFFQKGNLMTGVLFLSIPIIILFLGSLFYTPKIGLLAIFIANYFAMGIARYIPGPLGLSIDGFLVLTWLALIFSQFNNKVDWKKAWNGLTVVSIIWFLYAVFELFNPEAVSSKAWFYAMRGVALYMMLLVPLTFIMLDNKKYLDIMIRLLAWFTIIAVLKGLLQKIIGPDPWEQYWLATVGGKTHLLPQGLRIFSFFTDAATYGGSMAFSGVVFTILALYSGKFRNKVFYASVALLAFYGMMISGTRGALAVPFAGFTLFAILSKRMKLVLGGGIIIFVIYAFLKFTTIGASVYEIRRFRTALDPDNPSLTVRKENQMLLKDYLATRPFGGGIGSAGNWGLRFSPGTFLAETPPDGWYIQIWAEQGRVGLLLHLGILIYMLYSGSRIIMFKLKTPELKGKASALLAGIFGIMIASYSSGGIGQVPNGIIIYAGMAFIFMMPEWEKRDLESLPDQ